MHPLFAQLPQLLRRRAARHEPIPGHVLRTTLPPSREMSIRRPGAGGRAGSGMVLFMTQPPRAPLGCPCPVASAAIDIVLDELQALAPSAESDVQPASAARPSESEGVHLRIDPQDHQRVRISGSMREVCAALDALIAVQ
jgi:hypothetical protein